MPNTQQLEDLTTQVRRDILRMVHKVNSGHPGGSLGCAEFFVALYQEIMDRKEGFDMDGIGEDLFFLSNGHISPVFYSVLARSGYFPVEELNTFSLLIHDYKDIQQLTKDYQVFELLQDHWDKDFVWLLELLKQKN